MMEDEVGGIILAGGKSSRMGEDKGLMEYRGKEMIRYGIETLKKLTSNLILVANNVEYDKFGVQLIADEVEGQGPLMGIISGLNKSACEWNWVLSCDAPHISVELLERLNKEMEEDVDVIWSVENERIHPLIGMYRRRALPMLRKQWTDQNRKLMMMQKYLKVKMVNFGEQDHLAFKNINEKRDL